MEVLSSLECLGFEEHIEKKGGGGGGVEHIYIYIGKTERWLIIYRSR